MAVLGTIWHVRCSRVAVPGVSFARRVVHLAVQHLVEAIQRDWSRTQGDVRLVDAGAFCVDWWRGVDLGMRPEVFVAQWASPPIFCRVVAAPFQEGLAGPVQLEMLIGLADASPSLVLFAASLEPSLLAPSFPASWRRRLLCRVWR